MPSRATIVANTTLPNRKNLKLQQAPPYPPEIQKEKKQIENQGQKQGTDNKNGKKHIPISDYSTSTPQQETNNLNTDRQTPKSGDPTIIATKLTNNHRRSS